VDCHVNACCLEAAVVLYGFWDVTNL